MKKRNCDRFSIPGTTIYYKNKPGLFIKPDFADQYYPVINISRGGAKFLCNERLTAGKSIVVKLDVPGMDRQPELLADVRWISRNPEQSYPYQTGIAFNAYGGKKNQNPMDILAFFEAIEQKKETEK